MSLNTAVFPGLPTFSKWMPASLQWPRRLCQTCPSSPWPQTLSVLGHTHLLALPRASALFLLIHFSLCDHLPPVTRRLSLYFFAQMSPSQWCLCNLPSYFKFQSLSTASLSSPGGHSQAEEVTGCHQLGTTFGRAASPAFSLKSRLGPSVSLGESLQRPCLW